jgi:hypothetical protein
MSRLPPMKGARAICRAESPQKAEWGTLICEKSGRFEWSRFVTDFDNGQVTIPRDQCGANKVFAAEVHVHPYPYGQTQFSTGDIGNANFYPGIPWYVRLPRNEVNPTTTDILKTWNTGDRSAGQNICRRTAAGLWEPFVGSYQTDVNARCDTPQP